MKVPLIDLTRQHEPIKNELMQAFEKVLDSNQFILGNDVKQFENEIATYIGTKHAIGVSNCTNALMLSLKVLGIGSGDEVITPAFTFIATAEVIAILGAKPVFCDIDPKTMNIDPNKIPEAISDNTKAIIPVHLYGQSANMEAIMSMAENNNIKVVEDMAQAIGATYKGKKVGILGDTACISFFPTKNLNALGDAGMILTNNDELAKKLISIRVHGSSLKYHHDIIGYNERLDTIQAAFLRIKLKYLNEWNEGRKRTAKKYDAGLKGFVETPFIETNNESVYHQYTIRTPKRDELREFLSQKGIGTAVHYPLPLHFQQAFKYLGYEEGDFPESEKAANEVLSLPIHHTLTDEEVEYVISNIKQFFSH